MVILSCYFFSFFAEAAIVWMYASKMFAARKRQGVRCAVLCVLYFVLFAVAQFGSREMNAVFYFCVNFLFFITQFELKGYSAFFHSLLLMAFMAMCELMAYGIVRYMAPHFLENESGFPHMILFAVLNKLMFFITIYFVTYFMKKTSKQEQHDKSVFLFIFIPLTSVFATLTLINISEETAFSASLNWMLTLSAVFLLVNNLLIFGINQYNQKKSMEFTDMQLLVQKESASIEYYKMLLQQNENQSILIHDIKKHLQSIGMLNERREHDKIDSYIRQLMLSSDLKKTTQVCDHELLNAILCQYKCQCMEQAIDFHADIRSRTMHFIADNDLTSLFCNLLDNAVSAAAGIPDAFIEISAAKREGTSFVVITMINSCRNNPLSKNNGRLITSKSNKKRHGFGMKSIRKIVSKYDGNIQIYYHEDTHTFHTIITLSQSDEGRSVSENSDIF